MIQAFEAKLSHRVFCLFPVAVLVPIWMDTNMEPSYEALLIWAKNFFTHLSYDKLHWVDLARIFAYLPPLISWVLDFIY